MDVISNNEKDVMMDNSIVKTTDEVLELLPYHLTDESLYKPLEESPILEKLIPQAYKLIYNIGYIHKIIVITNYGLLFKKICC